jgi:hypothetical protein
LFAYAGQRFVDSHEFHIDQARWDVANIKFYPNSRFGVGVLSYFMLAEELDIVSRRWAPLSDIPLGSVHARIIGSGSLFRLESAIDLTRLTDDYGTSVRLYFREDAPVNDVLRKSILDWLALPEVLIRSNEMNEPLELAAGQPTQSLSVTCGGILLAVPGSSSTTGAARVFLAPYRSLPQNQGSDISDRMNLALVDGIRTQLANKPWPQSLIVNLTEDLPKTLTVDRRSVTPHEEAVEKVQGWVRKEAGSVLAAWTDPNFAALHFTLRDLHPDVAAVADAAFRVATGPALMIMLPGSEVRWPVRAGVSDIDPDIASDLLTASGVVGHEPGELVHRLGTDAATQADAIVPHLKTGWVRA